ncbi:MAG: 30S ribosomal protein S8 [Patescibacteria group bacterium]
MMTDPISDMLTRMRNALKIKQKFVIIPFSNFKSEILNVMKKNGYLEKIEESGEIPAKYLKVTFKYNENGQPTIHGLKKISKPGRKMYITSNRLPVVLSGLGVAILSTSAGVMTNLEAKKKNLGGECICEIY